MIGIIFGPPGSGKGTQAARIEKEFHLAHLSTGAILRAEVTRGTEIGKEVGRIMAAGDLVPDDIIVSIVRQRLPESEAGPGVLLDGFPRTLEQAEALDDVLLEIGSPLDVVFDLQIDEQTCIERLVGRAREEGRSDDTPEAIATRLQLFRDATLPVIEHYRAQGKVVGVHAAGTVNEVFNEIQEALEQVGAR